ncbi:hypothetical protein FRC17_010635, partial [Serendipita sp. 399]
IANTPSSRKRARADSSPSFGEFSPIGIEDLEILNKIEASFTQQSSPLTKRRKSTPTKVVESAPAAHVRTPSKSSSKASTVVPNLSKEHIPSGSLTSHCLNTKGPQAKRKDKPESSDEFDGEFDEIDAQDLPPEDSYDSWLHSSVDHVPTFVSFTRPTVGSSASAPKIIQPSAAAMNAARKLFEEVEAAEQLIIEAESEPKSTPQAPQPSVPIQVPQSSKPRLSVGSKLTTHSPSISSSKFITPAATPLRSVGSNPSQRTYVYHPSHPASKSLENVSFGSAIDPHESCSETPVKPILVAESPASAPRHLGMRSRPRGTQKSPFLTPWKSKAPSSVTTPSIKFPSPPKGAKSAVTPTKITLPPSKRKSVAPLAHSVFDLNYPGTRLTLKDLGIPRKRSVKCMLKMGIPAAVGDIETWNAKYWAFEEDGRQLGVDAAFSEMKRRGCTLLEKAWLENHWSLVVWKLANIVAVWPSTQAERCYEREINRCERPAIRLIQERDASPNSAMILCVYEINLPDAKQAATMPGVVLTDGWYRIRAQIDATLARAIAKRKIRVGKKLEIIGAKLSANKKDADEVLKSFDSSSIIITANGTHLAPWNAKLGFIQRPSIPTLKSLTHDGGNVPFMFVTLDEVLPLVYIETLANGDRRTRDEAEEDAAKASWEASKSRSEEEARLRDEIHRQMEKLEGLIERAERLAGAALARVRKSEDSPPDHIDTIVDDLEDVEDVKPVLKGLTSSDAAWLTVALQEKLSKQQETMVAEMESELTLSFPSRNVRSMRVVQIRDARTTKSTAVRTAQVNVWNAEEIGDILVRGKTYMV